jgi:putative transposase
MKRIGLADHVIVVLSDKYLRSPYCMTELHSISTSEFIRLWQTNHVLTSPHCPQSNGKLDRFHRTLKEQAIRPKTPLCLEDALRVSGHFIDHYNTVRLHSAIGYITPQDKLLGRDKAMLQARDEKLQHARERRRQKRATQYPAPR